MVSGCHAWIVELVVHLRLKTTKIMTNMGHWYYLMGYGFVPIIWKKLAIMTSFRKEYKKWTLKLVI